MSHEEKQTEFKGPLFINETLRDRFAMAALTGLVGHPRNREDYELLANMAFQIADAMMNRREDE